MLLEDDKVDKDEEVRVLVELVFFKLLLEDGEDVLWYLEGVCIMIELVYFGTFCRGSLIMSLANFRSCRGLSALLVVL